MKSMINVKKLIMENMYIKNNNNPMEKTEKSQRLLTEMNKSAEDETIEEKLKRFNCITAEEFYKMGVKLIHKIYQSGNE